MFKSTKVPTTTKITPDLYNVVNLQTLRFIFSLLARDSIYAIAHYMPRPSVCPSVRHTGGSVKDG